jgi:hypothetical protein
LAVAVIDGPFAETKEALGGYYVVEANDLDTAVAIAKQVTVPFRWRGYHVLALVAIAPLTRTT